jgi:hypothetical protein
MIEKIHAFFNRGKKQTDWKDNVFVPIVRTVDVYKGKRTGQNDVFYNNLKDRK